MTKKQIVDYLTYAPYDVLFQEAQNVRREYCGKRVFIRGIVDFSNNCVRNCMYCGLRCENSVLQRYRMSVDEIVNAVGIIAGKGMKSVILQSGDDLLYTQEMLCVMIKRVKRLYPAMAITLSLGERPDDDYRAFYDAGAERYLLKIETTDTRLYGQLHPRQSLRERLRILDVLRETGYQVGTGTIIGLPSQSIEDIAADIVFFKDNAPDMIAIGPFIPQKDTPFKENVVPDVSFVLKVYALIRVLTKDTLIPATTALATLDPVKGLSFGIKAGCNVIMCNGTPPVYRKDYILYDNKADVSVSAAMHAVAQEQMLVSFDRGDSFKTSYAQRDSK